MKAYLMHRYVNHDYGVFELWKTEDGKVFELDFNAHVRKTMVCPYDMDHGRVESWIPLLVRHKDMTGGKAIRELGYEPVEEDWR